MLSTDREVFDKQLASMFGAWNRVLSADAKAGYWKGCELMSIGDFVRCCNKAVQGYTEDSTHRLPDVGALWAMKRGLRMVPQVERTAVDNWSGDTWDQKANLRLLAYTLRQGTLKHYYDEPSTRMLVQWKNGWAGDMRESAADGTLPEDGGKAWWQTNMQRAEEQIAAEKAARAAA